MTIIAFNRYWVIRWHWVVVSLLATAFLMSLSLWQLSRASEKKQTLERIAQWNSAGPFAFNQLTAFDIQELDGVSLKFSARWISPMVWLLDNQLVDGRIGYDVIVAVEEVASPIVVKKTSSHSDVHNNSSTVLVNLGWVAAPARREELPRVHIPASLIIEGIFRTKPTGLLLGTNIEDKGTWPMRIQQLDAKNLAAYLPVLNTSGVIFQQQQSPFVVHYEPVILPPERHQAYALQWGLLAFAVVVISLAASSTKELSHDQP
ncbi:SURF1 family protein [Cellvibrio fontiphilus]|uniref:SURF1-like protein n=1 Tax=Cellvibrio fontiphilus TaxID=1815559 RepID=A0ABV7FKX9_9GAMM